MFLTKKGLKKVILITLCFLFTGVFCILASVYFSRIGVNAGFLLVLGIIICLISGLVSLCGWSAEGKDKLINTGNRLVRRELRPKEFLNEYETIRNSADLIVEKTNIDVLYLVAVAYDLLNDSENCLATVEEMIAAASDKKKAYVNLIKVSFLYSYDRIEEAEVLFNEIQKCKLDLMCNALVDVIVKSDRAFAMGDYKIAEMHSLKMLEQKLPKLDNLGLLIVNHKLAEIYEKTQDNEKAIKHYRYCAIHGGNTAIKTLATEKLKHLE